jgi:hypothetical protein
VNIRRKSPNSTPLAIVSTSGTGPEPDLLPPWCHPKSFPSILFTSPSSIAPTYYFSNVLFCSGTGGDSSSTLLHWCCCYTFDTVIVPLTAASSVYVLLLWLDYLNIFIPINQYYSTSWSSMAEPCLPCSALLVALPFHHVTSADYAILCTSPFAKFSSSIESNVFTPVLHGYVCQKFYISTCIRYGVIHTRLLFSSLNFDVAGEARIERERYFVCMRKKEKVTRLLEDLIHDHNCSDMAMSPILSTCVCRTP